MYKVRFNLGKGRNYMKWRVTSPNGSVEYLDPLDITLVMTHCKLRNQKGAAEKINKGADKVVCAWVECKELEIKEVPESPNELDMVRYNPRVKPYWMCPEGNDIDNVTFGVLETYDRNIHIRER